MNRQNREVGKTLGTSAARKSVKKILVVEDNEDNRDILVHRLKALGAFEILVASNGKEALALVSQTKPDLVIMDLKMPVMDGWEATRALRQTEWGKSLPIIALTAHAMEGHRESALEAGCDDYIAKPIMNYSSFLNKIQKLLKLKISEENSVHTVPGMPG
jgi:CheY-like chemotaxis protein